VTAFKKRRRKNSRRKRGYRDEITVLRITEILTNDNKPTIGPRPKREKVAAAAPAAGDDEAPRAVKKKATAKKTVAKAPAAKPRAKTDAKKAEAKKAPAKKAPAKGKGSKK
jgi:large subunit ribosomal protein L21